MKSIKYLPLHSLVKRVKVGFVGSIEKYYCDEKDGGIPLYRTMNLSDDGLTKTDLKYVTDEFNQKNKKSQLKKNDVLIARHGDNGKACVYEDDSPAQALNVVIIEPNTQLMSPYLLRYLLQSSYVRKQIDGAIVGSVQGVINTETISNLILPVLSDVDYTCIERILRKIELKTENNNSISSVFESLAKTIYDYWFVQFDFPDENGKPYKSSGGKMVWNEDLKKEIPEGWEVKPLSDVFDITMGSSPKGESLNEDGEGIEFYQGSTDFGDLYPSMRVYTNSPVRFAKAQDVLLSVRAPVGDMNIAMNDCCIGRGLAAIHHNSTMYAYCTMKSFAPYFDVFNGSGTTFGALTSDGLKGQLMIVPTDSVLKIFIDNTNPVGHELRKIALENQQLVSLRDFLLPMLMNGQVKVES